MLDTEIGTKSKFKLIMLAVDDTANADQEFRYTVAVPVYTGITNQTVLQKLAGNLDQIDDDDLAAIGATVDDLDLAYDDLLRANTGLMAELTWPYMEVPPDTCLYFQLVKR